MKKILNNKIFLITGGTGSFGSEMARYLIGTKISKIIIFSRDEKKQEEMRNKFKSEKIQFILGDVRDYNSIYKACKKVDFIFHAAALKQVPSCEFYPIEAINTNILGAENVMKAASENKVKKCIFLSTDKAVYPINAMGMTKALMEKIVIANSRNNNDSETIFCVTRYGNIANSRGSVIPHFQNLINQNKSVTITDPSMTRFLMSLEDSVNLVLYALKYGRNGETFIQKSPSCKILDLAEVIKYLMKKQNIKNKYIGTRHGEKKYEVLVSAEEMIAAKESKNYFRIPMDSRNLNYEKYFVSGKKSFNYQNSYNSNNTKILNKNEIKKFLKKAKIF